MSAQTKRTFNQTLDALRRGGLSDELDAHMQKLVSACAVSERAGSITLKLTLKPGAGGAFDIVDDIKVTMPKEQKGTSLMYPTVEGFLSRSDPRQDELPGLTVAENRDRRAAMSG